MSRVMDEDIKHWAAKRKNALWPNPLEIKEQYERQFK